MANMKMTKKRMREMGSPVSDSKRNHYPWGLNIHLEKEEMDKLSLDIKDLNIGDSLDISGKAEITSISQNADGEDNTSQNISLQITNLDVNS